MMNFVVLAVVVVVVVVVVGVEVEGVDVRKEVRELTETEWKTYYETVRIFKEEGRRDVVTRKGSFDNYNEMIAFHAIAAANETHGDQAHRWLSFLIWHACFIREYELALQSISPGLTVPYWDWSADAEMDDPRLSSIFTVDYFGETDPETYIVINGPFANWTVSDDPYSYGLWWESPAGFMRGPSNGNPQPFMTRLLGEGPLPSYEEYYQCIFNSTSYGDINTCGGASLHGTPHSWVGGRWGPLNSYQGEMLDLYTSPTDPLFFGHHGNLDRLFYQWRVETGESLATDEDPCGDFYGTQTVPQPTGHNLNDVMYPSYYTFEGVSEPLSLAQACYYLQPSRAPYTYDRF
jgi:tyrosinase